MEELKKILENIIDPRDSRGKRHCLLDIMVISVCGILCGCMDFDDIVDYAKGNISFFEKHLSLWNGIATAKTFREVFRVIKAEEFLEGFMYWINSIISKKDGKQVIIDGKAIRAATEKVTNGNIPYIVSAYMADVGLSIGQVKVDSKSNEITAIPELLDILDIEGYIITIDAIGTQSKIMDKIVSKKGHFVLPLKRNQNGAYKEIEEYFEYTKSNPIEQKNLSTYRTLEKGHGRIEERNYTLTTDLNWFNNKSKWKHVKSSIMVETSRTINNETSYQTRYYISDELLSIEEFAQIIRNHWQIENNLHWVLDMYFREDLSRCRKDNSLENFSLVRKLCYNIIKMDTRFGKLSIKRKINKYRWQKGCFEELLFKVIPKLTCN